MLDDETNVLYKAKNDVEAGMVTDILKKAGIPYFAKSRGAGSEYMGSALCGVYVYVDSADMQRARELVADIETPAPLPDDFDPNDYEFVDDTEPETKD